MRYLATTTALILVLAACGGSAADAPDTTGGTDTTAAPTTGSTSTDTTSGPAPDPLADLPTGELPEGPSALEDMDASGLPDPLVEPSQIISGGPPPDGIPPIDDPGFTSVEDADEWLEDDEPVILLEVDGVARAYPVQIMMWHEIVNDTIAGTPVAVTYCPLCNSAVTYERTINGVETTFGTSGRLFASALVMYDRATESLWTHFDGRAVVGVLAGARLDPIPSPLVAWEDFVAAHPDGEVLDREQTGFNRQYGSNPYVGYDNPDTQPFLFRGDVDDRAAAKQRIVAVTVGDDAVAWSLDAISGGEAKATHGTVGGRDVVILWSSGQSSALEAGSVDGGRDVGTAGVFIPEADGTELTFEADGEMFTDTQTGSTWDVTGRAVDGELAGTQLERIHHLDTFWFAWATYQPETKLIES